MIAIVYISSAVQLSDADLADLLAQSREKNGRLEVTGILLYKDGDIMQLIEGPDEAVRSLAKTIYADRRHQAIIQLLERKIVSARVSGLVHGISRVEPLEIGTACPVARR